MVHLSNFQQKANIVNCFFSKQCTLVWNSSVLPKELTYMTEERIHWITFSESDVIKIIRALNVNKAHWHDNISVRMIKLCANSVTHPLTVIFQNSLVAGMFKLKQNDVSGNLFQLITNFLSGRFQTVILNGQTDWETICTVVPQGSNLGPLFFLIHITY